MARGAQDTREQPLREVTRRRGRARAPRVGGRTRVLGWEPPTRRTHSGKYWSVQPVIGFGGRALAERHVVSFHASAKIFAGSPASESRSERREVSRSVSERRSACGILLSLRAWEWSGPTLATCQDRQPVRHIGRVGMVPQVREHDRESEHGNERLHFPTDRSHHPCLTH